VGIAKAARGHREGSAWASQRQRVGCSVSQKVFAQRGGHVRHKVVSGAVLSLRKCLLREVATSGINVVSGAVLSLRKCLLREVATSGRR